VQGSQSVQVSKSAQLRQGTMDTSSTTPPPILLVVFISLVPLPPLLQNRVSPLNGVSWQCWRTTTDSSHSMGSVQDGRASASQTPPEQERLKVLSLRSPQWYSILVGLGRVESADVGRQLQEETLLCLLVHDVQIDCGRLHC